MSLKTLVAATFAALCACTPALAADKDVFLDHLAGNWLLTGVIAGQATTHDVKADWVLQNSYLRLTEISREKDAAGKPQYEAEVLLAYDPAMQHYVCFWFDNTVIAGTADGGVTKRIGDALSFLFKGSDGDFRNTMTYDAKLDRWSWVMDAEKNGKTSPFAKVTLQRP